MSLLLDALKRAEQEKHGRQGERTTTPAKAIPGKPTLELAPIASPESATARSNPSAAPPPVGAAHAPRGGRSRYLFPVAGGIVAVLVILAVAYVWYSIDALSPKSVARVPVQRPVTPALDPIPAPPNAKLETPVSGPPPATPRVVASAKPPVEHAAAVEVAPAPALLQPSRTADRARVAPEVGTGYEALRRGDLVEAKRSYAAAQSADATNLDATIGLATVEARLGNRQAALAMYRRTLEIDPRNPTALAALVALSDLSRPEAIESQLQRDVSQNPGSAALHFTLGNLHAAQGRWSQAQAAYFDAHRLDPANADVLHNLAVSLDRLGQARLAASYYKRALDAARAQPAQFDAALVQRRVQELDAAR